MRLKTIRENLLFIAWYHHDMDKKCMQEANSLSGRPKYLAAAKRKTARMHRKWSEAADEALKLL